MVGSEQGEPRYVFGPFVLDARRRQLLRGETTVPLSPKLLDTLLALVQRAGQLVQKDELLQTVWCDTVVEENNLTHAVSRLRKALGEQSGDHRYIVTVPGAGYRFVAPVRCLAAEAETGHDGGEKATAGRVDVLASSIDARPHARPGGPTRLIVLPFRILRSDPETDFLAFSLADAITIPLSGLSSLVVRSPMMAGRFSADTLDPEAIARQAGVDAVLSGTLLRDGAHVRVNTQLIDVPAGTVRWSQTAEVRLGDIFQLQDHLVRRIVESLSLPLSGHDRQMLARDVPADSKAYEFYLRANQCSYDAKLWVAARDLYRRCLDDDPGYAPAWARLGRIYRILALYASNDPESDLRNAEAAFQRALAINPDLAIAHNLYTYLEVDRDGADRAIARLLRRASQGSEDPELFAGLVQACRYAGLLHAAIAAHQRARALDPNIRTSVAHAYWMLGLYDQAGDTDLEHPPMMKVFSLIDSGRTQDALNILNAAEQKGVPPPFVGACAAFRALLEGRRVQCSLLLGGRDAIQTIKDACGRFYVARLLAHSGEQALALEFLESSVMAGFFCYPFFARDPWLDTLRADDRFVRIMAHARVRAEMSFQAFRESDGVTILGRFADSLDGDVSGVRP